MIRARIGRRISMQKTKHEHPSGAQSGNSASGDKRPDERRTYAARTLIRYAEKETRVLACKVPWQIRYSLAG